MSKPEDKPLNREQELWAMALWVVKHHGVKGRLYIAQQQDRLLAEGSFKGAAMWRAVSERYEKLLEKISDRLEQ